jgi:phosphate transport system protein
MSKHLRRELNNLKDKIITLSSLVQENLKQAIKSLSERDFELASQILTKDMEIDEMEIEVEEVCLKILALYHPVAVDLRYIIAVLKLNNDLERIGDLTMNITLQILKVIKCNDVKIPFNYIEMSDKALVMLENAITAMLKKSSKLAKQVCIADDEVDKLHYKLIDLVKNCIARDPENSELYLSMLAISYSLERIADHATNIAEDIIYMLEGDIIRHRMPKL